MRVVFVLGSGVSLDAGMPRVSAITDQVNAGDGVWRHSSGVYVLDGADASYELYRPRVARILDLIGDIRQRVAAVDSQVVLTYEDLALVLQQLRDALSGEYENPAILPFADQLLGRAGLDRDGIRTLCDEALDYITDTVASLLRRGRITDHQHLGAIVEACRRLGRVDLATLNHDLLLEKALEANAIGFADGFERTAQDVRFWTDEWHDAPVRVLKLHGSVDWYDFRCRSRPDLGWIPARYVGRDPEHPERPGVQLRSAHPTLLSGTFTKILAYQTGHFPDVHMRVYEALRDANRVVVIGYGFGDKAINSHLIRWLARATPNRLTICHEHPERLRSGARLAIQKHWDEWAAAGRLRTIPAFVRDLEYATLAADLSR